ncbi:MAG: amino acid adenylation domain-containing protein [Acaryochloris sp. RU_4_1]|nr:amino acid adenylation domain-containing protein [Acaryochloris sp. RU_4_1]
MTTAMMQGFRLSLQQEWLWDLQQAVPQGEPYPYWVLGQIAIEGSIQPDVLATAIQTLVQRHEIFRTTFVCPPGMTLPVQMISEQSCVSHQTENLSHLEPQVQETQLAALWQQWIDPANHDLQDLPWQSLLVILSPTHQVLLVHLSALHADAVTLSQLVAEIGRCYQAILEGESIADDPLQYADFAEWQQTLLETKETAIGKAYWRKQDYAALQTCKLPFEHSVTQQTGFAPQHITSTFTAAQTTKLTATAQAYDVSTSTILLTCWYILLWRWTGEPKIVIGTACTGRKYAELATVYGNLTKYLPLVHSLPSHQPFSVVLKEIDASLQDMHQWQDCFTWDCVAWDQVSDSGYSVIPSPSPLSRQKHYWPIGYDYHQLPAPSCHGDLFFSLLRQSTCLERFNLKLACLEQEQTLATEFHYDVSLFNDTTVQEIAAQFHQLVDSAIHTPDIPIGELNPLHNRHQILVEFNQTQAHYPQEACIHHLISAQAERFPTGIAVACANQQLTYQALEDRSNELAYHLQQLGVGAEVLVGICVERSPLMIIGILGILKAGGAYVPLDPTYPKTRLAFLLQDAQVSLLLTQKHLISQLPTQDTQVLCLDADWDTMTHSRPKSYGQQATAIAHHTSAPVTSTVTPDNLAYVIYTSGSTGQPKGVQITHRNLVHSTYARILTYPTPIHRFLLLSSFAFDSSVAGIFWSLCQGGELHLPEVGLERDPAGLVAAIAQDQISHLLTLPSLYNLLLEAANPDQLASLQTVIVAGEVCPTALLRRHWQRYPNTQLFNEYGPTEGTVWSTVYPCQPQGQSQETDCEKLGWLGTVPIGRPIANAQIYILDAQQQPVPIGVTGELYVGGEGVARGYLHQLPLTDEKFIPHPFTDDLNARLYRTGDLARYRPDGDIEFLGRIDDQIKLRGFRIELGEIEGAIAHHPAVLETVVLMREDSPGDQRLVAYVCSKPDADPNLTDILRQTLRETLPDYMVPSAFVLLSALPRTPNGKIDRQALPALDQEQSLARTFAPPRTPTEEQLAGIWAEVLNIKQVGIHDNFFDLGGHSLLATQLASRCRDTFHVEILLRQFFAAPTIADLAILIAQQLADASDETLLAQTLAEIQQLSDAEAQAVLANLDQENH